jgi:hypothetical protein
MPTIPFTEEKYSCAGAPSVGRDAYERDWKLIGLRRRSSATLRIGRSIGAA